MNGVGYLLIRATYLISVSAEQLAGQLQFKSSLTKNWHFLNWVELICGFPK